MQDLVASVYEVLDVLDDLVKQYEASGCQLAENEAEYRKALRIEQLTERQRGTPVSLIGDVCRGKPRIADLKLKRDSAEAIYKATGEAINVNKLRLRTLNEMIAREYQASYQQP